MEEIFTKIYEEKTWGNNNHPDYNGSSGNGSEIGYNQDTYVPFLKNFIKEHNITTVADLGCGDFKCGKLIYDDLNVSYTGYDAYKKIVDFNSRTHPFPKYNFKHLDISGNKEEIVSADLCILKDVLQHWSTESIYILMDYLTSSKKFKYILLCNCCKQSSDNEDAQNGGYRQLSSELLPLKKYNPHKLYNYHNKEVTVIDLTRN